MRRSNESGVPRGALSFLAVALVVSWLGAGKVAFAEHEEDEDEIPFTVGQVLIQLNDTDGDLGFHARVDGDAWKRVRIFDPKERKLFDLRIRGRLRRQGLTELSFESAEPTFDELAPDVFFKRFPEGEYEIEGVGIDGRELESTSAFSHLIPAAPDNLTVSGAPASEDCEVHVPFVGSPVEIAWDPVDSSHPELGRPGDVIIDSYEVSVEAETVTLVIDVDGGTTAVAVPDGAIPSGEEVKYQVLVREAGGNEASSESCFIAP